MKKPALIVSDVHFHNWDAFSTTLKDGRNSRLQIQLNEFVLAAHVLRSKHEGNLIIGAGDWFHTRGRLQPSVLNPVVEMHQTLIREGFEIVLIAGNHDLEGKSADDLGSAITALREVGCQVINAPTKMPGRYSLIPWIENLDELKTAIQQIQKLSAEPEKQTLIIHAPVNGVIKGLNGLDAAWLNDLKFGRVYAGHYHFHKALTDKVISIGALTHQTWGDVGSTAGFIIDHGPDKPFQHYVTQAPRFVRIDDLSKFKSDTDLQIAISNHYVRVDLPIEKDKDVRDLRTRLTKLGALGVIVNPIRENRVTRTSSAAKPGASLRETVDEYLKLRSDYSPELESLCGKILTKAMEISE